MSLTQTIGTELRKTAVLCAAILLLRAPAIRAGELTNTAYLEITRSQAAGDLGGMVRLLSGG